MEVQTCWRPSSLANLGHPCVSRDFHDAFLSVFISPHLSVMWTLGADGGWPCCRLVQRAIHQSANLFAHSAPADQLGALLQTATVYGHTAAAQILMQRGANANAHQAGVLCAAARGGHIATVQALLGAGADVQLSMPTKTGRYV